MVANADQEGLDPHDQDAKLPGATLAGKEAAAASSVVWREPVAAVNDWLATPAHRALLLEPALHSIGVGFARLDSGRCVTVFDALRGQSPRKPSQGEQGKIVLYPTPRQAAVPLVFPGNEIPDPLPRARNKLAGYPITVTFPSEMKVITAEGWLEDEAGKEVPVWFSTPTRPANETYPRTQQNTVCLFAREVLQPGMRYVVLVQANIRSEWSRVWSFTTASPVEVNQQPYDRALARFNVFRKAAGLEAVRLDSERCAAARAHAAYLARHLDHTPGIRAEEERSDLPGYTEAGNQIAKRAAVRIGGGAGAIDCVDWMLASVLNRHLVLNPSMESLGLGTALQVPRGWVWVLSLPTGRREGDSDGPTLYPGPDQKDVPLFFGREVNTLVSGQARDAIAGFAVTANFFPRAKLARASGSLTDGSGKVIPCWLSTPQKPLRNVGTYNQIILVPQKPLPPAATLTAAMSAEVDGKEWTQTWRFTTTDPTRYQAEVSEVLLERVNRARSLAGLSLVKLDSRLSRGCLAHAGYIQRNIDHPKLQGLGIHDEDPTLPGATPEGAQAGKGGVIAIISNPADSVDGWLATLYHRIPLLDPHLKRLGYGQSLHPLRGWVTVLDATTGK
jgi:uncharacterized protein YkwD